MPTLKIVALQKQHIENLLSLMQEFDDYLGTLSSGSREIFNVNKKKEKILKDGFWKNPQYRGYLAKLGAQPVGYILYHYGYDPDEMEGKVIHIIDLFVSEKTRGHGVGKLLMKQLQEKEEVMALYFWVWKKNHLAIDFYKKLGADWIEDVPYMRLPI